MWGRSPHRQRAAKDRRQRDTGQSGRGRSRGEARAARARPRPPDRSAPKPPRRPERRREQRDGARGGPAEEERPRRAATSAAAGRSATRASGRGRRGRARPAHRAGHERRAEEPRAPRSGGGGRSAGGQRRESRRGWHGPQAGPPAKRAGRAAAEREHTAQRDGLTGGGSSYARSGAALAPPRAADGKRGRTPRSAKLGAALALTQPPAVSGFPCGMSERSERPSFYLIIGHYSVIRRVNEQECQPNFAQRSCVYLS